MVPRIAYRLSKGDKKKVIDNLTGTARPDTIGRRAWDDEDDEDEGRWRV